MSFEQPLQPKTKREADQESSEQSEGYARSFFDLQAHFARKVSKILQINLKDAFAKATALPNLAAQGERSLEKEVLDAAFERAAQQGTSPEQIFYETYRNGLEKERHTPEMEKFGCFSYEFDALTKTIRPHFTNRAAKDTSPLAADQLALRRQEIGEMLDDIRKRHPDAESFRSSSWLNNREEYRQLWPASLQQSLQEIPGRYHRMDLWGQFLDKDSKVNKRGEAFLQRLQQAESAEDLKTAFPYQVQEATCSMADVYEMYER